MSRAEDRGPESGLPGDAQDTTTGAQTARTGPRAAQKLTGATGTGTTSGAVATGTSTTAAGTDPATGANTAVRERTSMQAQGQARGTGPSADYRTEPYAATSTAGMMGGVLAVLAGLLTFLAGLGAVVRMGFYPNLPGYAYQFSVHSWGIILLVLGAALFAAGACALLGMAWARYVGVGLAVLAGVAAFLFLAYSPVWGAILVLLSAVAIWGLLHDSTADRGGSI